MVDNKVLRCDVRIHSVLEIILTSANDYWDTCIRSKLINHRIPRLRYFDNPYMNATDKANFNCEHPLRRTPIYWIYGPKFSQKSNVIDWKKYSCWQTVLPNCCCTTVNANLMWYFNIVVNYTQIFFYYFIIIKFFD